MAGAVNIVTRMTDLKQKYYLGGYFLTRLVPMNFGTYSEAMIHTCSKCINDHLVNIWSYSWTTDNDEQAEEAKENFQLSNKEIDLIRTWVDKNHNEHKLGWVNVFTDLETALEYKTMFFSHLDDIKIFALYFNERERADLLDEFKPQSTGMGEIGLRLTLLKGIEETSNDQFLGFDYIGIEFSGDFHTFHCHDLGREFSNKFKLNLNEYGLFDSDMNSDQVLAYLNDESNGCEPVPWFVAKTKLVLGL